MFRRHLIRSLILSAVVAAGVMTGAATATAAPAGCAAAETPYAQYTKKVPVTAPDMLNAEHATLYLVNQERAKANLPALCWSNQIGSAARPHAENWRGSTRTCPPSTSWFSCSHWDSRAGYAWPNDRLAKSGYGPCASNCVGENTQNGGGVSNGGNGVPAGMVYGTPETAVYWWMNHAAPNKHREAILRADWTDAGVGAASYKDAWNNNAAAFVLNFGKH